MTSLQSFYTGRTVLVTGGLGFMGKVLLEKMIRSLPGLEKIYVLTRPKKGLTAEERFEQLISEMPFTHDNIIPNTLRKLVCIPGDVTLEHLGLSKENRQKIINEVSIVFHMAASIRMNLTLKDAILQNVIGTQNVLNLCSDLKNLVSIVHLSTAYCNVDVDCMEEKVYPITLDPYKIIDLVQWMKESDLKKIQDSIISPHPNTYTFSKRLAEIIVADRGKILPISIARPSVVIPAYKEPIPGWIDSLTGAAGILIAGGKGIIKTMLGNANLSPELVPVDSAINSLILMACFRDTERISDTLVYNITYGDYYNHPWGKVIEQYRDLALKYPFKKKLSYPSASMTTNIFSHYVTVLVWHILIPYIVDVLLFLFLQEPFLVNVQDRINQGMNVLKYFVSRKFVFINDKCQELEKAFDSEEIKKFVIIDKNIDVDKFFKDSFTVVRKYCLKEEIIESEIYIRKLELLFLYLLNMFCKIVLIYYTVFLIFYVFEKSHWLTYNGWCSYNSLDI